MCLWFIYRYYQSVCGSFESDRLQQTPEPDILTPHTHTHTYPLTYTLYTHTHTLTDSQTHILYTQGVKGSVIHTYTHTVVYGVNTGTIGWVMWPLHDLAQLQLLWLSVHISHSEFKRWNVWQWWCIHSMHVLRESVICSRQTDWLTERGRGRCVGDRRSWIGWLVVCVWVLSTWHTCTEQNGAT